MKVRSYWTVLLNNRARDNSTYGCCLARTATTFSAIRDDPRDLSGSWGPSDTDFRHKFVLAVSLPAIVGVRVSGRYLGSNGRPFSAIVNGDINGDQNTSTDLAFVVDPDDPNTPSDIAAAMWSVLANPKNAARAYLRENLGRVASPNDAFAPLGRSDRGARSSPVPYGARAACRVDRRCLQLREPVEQRVGCTGAAARRHLEPEPGRPAHFRCSTWLDSIKRQDVIATPSLRILACCRKAETRTRSGLAVPTSFERGHALGWSFEAQVAAIKGLSSARAIRAIPQ